MPEISNYMESCVLDKIDDLIMKTNCCSCDLCRYDVLAIALNNLPPKYVVTNMGHLYTKLNMLQRQFDVDIIAAITRAIEIVTESPRHNEAER